MKLLSFSTNACYFENPAFELNISIRLYSTDSSQFAYWTSVADDLVKNEQYRLTELQISLFVFGFGFFVLKSFLAGFMKGTGLFDEHL